MAFLCRSTVSFCRCCFDSTTTSTLSPSTTSTICVTTTSPTTTSILMTSTTKFSIARNYQKMRFNRAIDQMYSKRIEAAGYEQYVRDRQICAYIFEKKELRKLSAVTRTQIFSNTWGTCCAVPFENYCTNDLFTRIKMLRFFCVLVIHV